MSGLHQSWRYRAACKNLPPKRMEDFFMPGNSVEGTRALRICAGCPVQSECLEYALDKPEDDGIWGGKTIEQRRRILRSRHPSMMGRGYGKE